MVPKKSKKQKKDDVEKLQQEVKQDTGSEVSSPEDGEVISKKKVIYIEIDDEVGAVYEKLQSVKGNHVYIVVPKRAVLFQSIVNLKILKRKADDESKTIYFITNDSNGIYLASQLGITVYDKPNGDGKPALFSTEVDDEKLRITPLRATVNSVDEDTPTRLTEKKLSISQILRKTRHNKTMDISKITSQSQKEKKKEKPKFVIVAPNRQALIGLVVFSLIVLLTIVYIALPGATIYLTPSASVLEKSVNITLADYQKNRVELESRPAHMIASYPASATVNKEITYTATGKRFSESSTNASGTITVINTSNQQWELIPNTRFQTDEGIVFRSRDYINVPPASADGPGKTNVFVVADQLDAYGEVVGERGNIGPSKLFLPGLREDSRSKLYAESSENMSGGAADFIIYVAPEDLDAARAKLEDELRKNAVEALRKEVNEKATLAGEDTEYILLEGDGAIKVNEPNIQISEDLIEQEIKEFKVSGSIVANGIYYDHDDMLEILRSELLVKKSPQKELLRVNEDSSSYRIFEWDEQIGKVKLTANIKGIEQYQIKPETENGQRLLRKIKDHVVGKEIADAELFIQNLPEINKVEIDSWPAWSPTIPNIPDNIDFEIQSAIISE